MKLLKDEVISLTAQGVSITMHPISSSKQARISHLSSDKTPEGMVALGNYALSTLIISIEINGRSFDPLKLVDAMDMADADTAQAMVTIGELAVTASFTREESKKKSAP